MSLKKIEQVRASKLFRVWDILVYVLLIACAVAMIVAFTVTRDNTPLDGVVITYRGQDVFTCDFKQNKYEILSQSNVDVVEDEGDILSLKIHGDDDGYNVVEIDFAERTAKVTDANCSMHKDCVYSPELKTNGSVPIICTPHGLVVRPLVFIDSGDIIM